ncbi:MAG: thioredoxin family protein [Chitinophagaceae bacterium]
MQIKKLLVFISMCLLLNACSVQKKSFGVAPPAYQIKTEGNEKVLVGILERNMFEKNTAFPWFKKSYDEKTPDAAAVKVFRQHAAEFQLVVFAGTWCEDTHNLLGGFYKLIDMSGFPPENITLIGVDQEHRSLFDLAHVFNITNVPTFIVMKNGKEVGRVVEYGDSGEPDKDLGKIVQGMK